MGKEEAYEEMCRKGKNKDGQYASTFDEVADIVERNMGISKEEVHRRLGIVAKIQKGEL